MQTIPNSCPKLGFLTAFADEEGGAYSSRKLGFFMEVGVVGIVAEGAAKGS